jgi:PAS domain S-box-containing protein
MKGANGVSSGAELRPREKTREPAEVAEGAEHPYRMLMEMMEEGAATLAEDGRVLYSNKSFASIFNTPLERFVGSRLQELVSGEDVGTLLGLLSRAKTLSVRGEIRLKSGNGRPRVVRLILRPNRGQGVDMICAVATELTDIVETNEALRVTETSLRQLSARLLQLQDEERRRIARDLHDITGQKIAVLSMALDRLARFAELGKSEAKEVLAESRGVASKIGEEIRTLSYILHPPLLDECGLASAVRWYAEGFEARSGIKLEVEIAPQLTRLPLDAETALFRVVQESLTNVHRYSGSSNAQIRILEAAGQVRLEVIDHGKGIRAGAVRSAVDEKAALGVGIPGMRERLRQLGGQLDVDFGTEGTRVVAVLPIKKAREGTEEHGCSEEPANPAEGSNSDIAQGAEHDARRRILIADDHEVMRRGVRGLIESQEEWAVCGEAVEGGEVINRVRELRPDLIILDINMPGLSGIDAAEQIRQENAATKILFFTVHESDQILREVVDVGAQGYVTKSRAGQDLVEAVRSVLDGRTFFPPIAAAVRRQG